MAVFGLLSLENRVALVDPFHRGGCPEVDFLGLKAARATVDDYASMR